MRTELPPIVRSVTVSWDSEAAFRRFTADFATWWPWRTHSIGGVERVERLVFECKPGGLIFERHKDGRRFQWGKVLEWDPPRRVKFTWHPSRDEATAQEVELRFHPAGSGTRLELVSSGWEHWGEGANGARRGYDLGWWQVLNIWADKRTLRLAVLNGVMRFMAFVSRRRGGAEAAIAKAGGEMRSAS